MSQIRNSFLGVKDPLILKGLVWGALFWLVGTIVLAVVYSRLPPIVPLFYTQIRGESQLGSKQFLALLPTFSFLALIVHFYIAKITTDSDRMFSRLITLTGTFISILYFVGLAHILIITL